MADKPIQPSGEDVGAAFLVWYGESLKKYPDGLVTQAQAAKMLGVNRMAVNRLVGSGYLRAVYFPQAPTVAGIAPGEDDPSWLRLTAWFGRWVKKLDFPDACYVSFGDVIELWLRGDASKKCSLSWREWIAKIRSNREDVRERIEIGDATDDAEQAASVKQMYGIGKGEADIAYKRVYMHDQLLDWFQRRAEGVGLPRNQLIFWALEQWRDIVSATAKTAPKCRMPKEVEVEIIHSTVRHAVLSQCTGSDATFIRALDEFGGDLGVYGSTGVQFDGTVG